MQPRQLLDTFRERPAVRDREAPIHGFGLVARELHRDAAGHAGTLEVADRGTPQIGKTPASEVRALARRRPRLFDLTYRLAAPMEHVRNDGAGLALECACTVALVFPHCPKRRQGMEGEQARLVVLGRPEPHLACVEVDLRPLQREHLAPTPAALATSVFTIPW